MTTEAYTELLISQAPNPVSGDKKLSMASLLSFEQPFQFANLRGGQFLSGDELGEHRLERAAKHPIEKGFAFGYGAIRLLDQRAVKVGTALLVETERALLTSRFHNVLAVLGCHVGSISLRASIISAEERGDWAQRTCITSHSILAMFGIGFMASERITVVMRSMITRVIFTWQRKS